jgi:23S rRNA (guanosine2251-2'-O)-methyltransferase
VPVRTVAEEDLGAQATSHGGLVLVCGPRPLTEAAELYAIAGAARPAPFVALLEGADDPRNLGTVLRGAEAFGAHAVLVRRRAWDVDATAVSRSSSGAFERLPITLVERALEEVAQLQKRGLRLVGCIPRARTSIYETDFRGPVIVAVGGEKRGLSGAVRSRCDALVRIPTRPGPTSLSMTQASAVAFAEVARQRG